MKSDNTYGVLDALRNFDAYPKTLEDFREKTFSGAVGEFLPFYMFEVLSSPKRCTPLS